MLKPSPPMTQRSGRSGLDSAKRGLPRRTVAMKPLRGQHHKTWNKRFLIQKHLLLPTTRIRPSHPPRHNCKLDGAVLITRHSSLSDTGLAIHCCAWMSRDTKSSVQTVAITKSTVAKANRRPQSISGTNTCQEQLTVSPFDPIKNRSSTRYSLLRPLQHSTRLPSYAINGHS